MYVNIFFNISQVFPRYSICCIFPRNWFCTVKISLDFSLFDFPFMNGRNNTLFNCEGSAGMPHFSDSCCYWIIHLCRVSRVHCNFEGNRLPKTIRLQTNLGERRLLLWTSADILLIHPRTVFARLLHENVNWANISERRTIRLAREEN